MIKSLDQSHPEINQDRNFYLGPYHIFKKSHIKNTTSLALYVLFFCRRIKQTSYNVFRGTGRLILSLLD